MEGGEDEVEPVNIPDEHNNIAQSEQQNPLPNLTNHDIIHKPLGSTHNQGGGMLTPDAKMRLELQVALWQKKIDRVQRMKNRVAERKKQLELEADLSYKIKQFLTFQWLFNKRNSTQ